MPALRDRDEKLISTPAPRPQSMTTVQGSEASPAAQPGSCPQQAFLGVAVCDSVPTCQLGAEAEMLTFAFLSQQVNCHVQTTPTPAPASPQNTKEQRQTTQTRI